MKAWFADRDHQILSGIVLLAFILRVCGLNAPLWYDEILTIETHLRLPWDEMMQTYSMNHHYLFSLQAKLMTMLFGEAAWSVRLPAMLFGCGSIIAIWYLARDIAGARIAHLTALLLAVSFHHIWFSQNARGYTELAFWSTLGMIFFLKGMKHPTVRTWLAYSLCLALAVATHLTGFFFFAAQGLIWLVVALATVRTRGLLHDSIKLPALAYALGGVLMLAFYAPVLTGVADVVSSVGETSASDVMSEYQSPLWSVMEAVRTLLGSMGPLVGIVAVAVIGLSLLGAIRLTSSNPWFGPIVGLHIVLTMVLLILLGMRIWPRFFFVDIGFLMLLIVIGVKWICDLVPRYLQAISAPALLGMAAAAMVALSAGLAIRNYTAPKQDLAGAVAYIEANATPNDNVYAVGVASKLFNGFYEQDWSTIETSNSFKISMVQPGTAYYVIAFPARYFRAIPEMEEMTEAGQLTLVKRLPGTLGDGRVLIFKKG